MPLSSLCQLIKPYLSDLRQHHAARDELSVVDGKIICRNRLVVPISLQSEILDRIHDGHQGMTKWHEKANRSF